MVLYQPEIPQNTGNIGRSCVGFGAQLWIVRPTGFQLDDRSLRRAGLDYWQHLIWHDVPDWTTLLTRLEGKTIWYFSRFAARSFWDVQFKRGDVLAFGSETSGLPPLIRDAAADYAVRIPTPGPVRSLNLASTVGIALAEVARQSILTSGCLTQDV